MGDRDSQTKPEKYPLLKVDSGGDKCHAQPEPSATTNWSVTTKQNTRISRWPEFISVCWMTVILCGISFFVFYALGMGVYRHRHQYMITKSNNSDPASNVFYHHIVPRGSQIPFVSYVEYLSYMAMQYPLLKFHVYFLVDDSYMDILRIRRHLPYHAHSLYKFDEIGKEALKEFEQRFQNVNVTIAPLSKYMATTSLRFKYRLIPMAFLPFFIRVISVWQNGGIGIDLRTFSKDFHSRHLRDPRIDAILKQHNDGINTEDYATALKKIERDDENAVFNMFYGFINNFLNETRSLINRTLLISTTSTEKSTLIRTHRSKREINDNSQRVAIERKGNRSDSKSLYTIVVNKTTDVVRENISKDLDETLDTLNSTNNQYNLLNESKTAMQNTSTSTDHDKSSDSHQVFVYDFVISSNIGPYFLTEPFSYKSAVSTDTKTSGQNKATPATKAVSHLLSIDSDGYFIAASSKFHPFLGNFIAGGCLRMPPKFLIQDALLTQCSGLFRDDVYCNNIFVL